jgi:hypothetical protein
MEYWKNGKEWIKSSCRLEVKNKTQNEKCKMEIFVQQCCGVEVLRFQ